MQDQLPQLTEGVREGDVLDGKYRVDRVLGAGAMGVVVSARHLHLDRKVAIKFLLPSMLNDADAVARFAREARAASRIRSEHVVQVLDVGSLSTGAPYMVMEFLEGLDLAAVLRSRTKLPFDEAVDFVLQASEALAEAHAFGVVHRDLKPSNLFCIEGADGRPCIKVLDFGISKMTAADGSGEMSMTRTAAVMGTPYYMSPEQLRASRDVDARSDIWAMGVLLYELTSGCVPFDGQSISDVSIKIATETPAALGTLRPDVPAGFEAVIARCLEKDRRKRYASVGELARDLVTYAPAHARRSVDAIGRTLKASSSPVVNGPQPAAILTETLAIPAASAGGAAVASPGGGAPAAPGTFRALGRTTGNATRDATGAATARRTTTLLAGAVGIALLVGIAGTMALRSRSTSLSSAIAPERPSAAAAPLPAPPPALKEQQTAAETVGTATIAPLGEPALAPSTADAVPLAPSVPSARAARKADTKPSPHPSIHPAEPPMAPHAPPSPDDPDPFSKLTPK